MEALLLLMAAVTAEVMEEATATHPDLVASLHGGRFLTDYGVSRIKIYTGAHLAQRLGRLCRPSFLPYQQFRFSTSPLSAFVRRLFFGFHIHLFDVLTLRLHWR